MAKIFRIAIRNLSRYKRRTILTASLITTGVVFVLVFTSVTLSFKNMMIGQITDSILGHLQIHKKGYVASIDNLPLTITLSPESVTKALKVLDTIPEVEAYSLRIKFGGLLSNYAETTNIRLNGVDPEKEFKVTPLLPSRIVGKKNTIQRGEIIVPDLLAKGLNIKEGSSVVVVATNKDGSVNAKEFRVGAVVESATGPGGRDGYLHIEDAMEILRMDYDVKTQSTTANESADIEYTFDLSEIDQASAEIVGNEVEISEIAVRLSNFNNLQKETAKINKALSVYVDKQGRPLFEVHTWEKLSPFVNIANMIDLMTLFIKLMLIAIVLISIMNVMLMAVYERIREIGTIAAIGTKPRRILGLYVAEGFSLGVFGAVVGNIVGVGIIYILRIVKLKFNFGMQTGLILEPSIKIQDLMVISVIVILVSVIASIQPAYKASKMDPITALKHV